MAKSHCGAMPLGAYPWEWKAPACAGVDQAAGDLIALSRYLHANPEVAYEEHKAAARLAEYLAAQGFQVERPIGGRPPGGPPPPSWPSTMPCPAWAMPAATT